MLFLVNAFYFATLATLTMGIWTVPTGGSTSDGQSYITHGTEYCHGGQTSGYEFTLRAEFNVCSLVILLAVLRIRHRDGKLAYVLDVVSSVCLVWATFTRQFYLRHTKVAHWASDWCSAVTSRSGLKQDYLYISILSWIASSFLRYTCSVHLYKVCPRYGLPEIQLSISRKAVLLTSVFCTLNSIILTVMLWLAGQQSMMNVSKDISVYVISNIAFVTRITRHFMEGWTFITGIATREFRWRNRDSEILFGRIAFSSFSLLIHSYVYTSAFSAKGNLKVSGMKHNVALVSLCIDVIFRLVVFTWATCNSSYFARVTVFVNHYCYVEGCCRRAKLLFSYIRNLFGPALGFTEALQVQQETEADHVRDESPCAQCPELEDQHRLCDSNSPPCHPGPTIQPFAPSPGGDVQSPEPFSDVVLDSMEGNEKALLSLETIPQPTA